MSSMSLAENFNNSNQMENVYEKVCAVNIDEHASKQGLSDELNDLDFKKFVDDLSGHVNHPLNVSSAKEICAHPTSPPKSRIIYERVANKETIIIDSIPNRNSDNVHVVKVKITLPRSTAPINAVSTTPNKPTISTKQCLSREGKGHHLPIMGKAALMAKLRFGSANSKSDDSEIIRDLVTQRFRALLKSYYEKSFHRQNSRQSHVNHTESLHHNQQEDDLSGISSITWSSQELINIDECETRKTQMSINNMSQSTINHVDQTFDSIERAKLSKSLDDHNLETETEYTRNQSLLNLSHNISNQLSQQTRAINAIASNKDESFVEYDATQFLKEALGDEIKNCHSTDVSMLNNSIGTSNISTLISATSRYDQVTCNSAIYEDTEDIYPLDIYPQEKKINDLLKQASAQNIMIDQISKALTFCKITKEFNGSTEELEAERILLIATCKREAIQAEIHRLEMNQTHAMQVNSRGSIKITNIVLPPKQRHLLLSKMFDKKKKQRRDIADWYLCIFSHVTDIFATRPITPDEDGFLRFDEDIVFDNLRADFEICVKVYVMKVRHPMRVMSHESKFHLNQDKTRMCPLSPPKLFNSHRELKNLRIPDGVYQQSAYMLGGQFNLTIGDIGRVGHFKLKHVALTPLQGSFIMDVSSSVYVNEDYSGFLDVGLECNNTIVWNRRWCSLNGPVLSYFNYPGEENALGFIDLQYCPSLSIKMADRRICPRPRTLLIQVIVDQSNDCTSKCDQRQYFLAADSKQYMEMWENKLNATLVTLRIWNASKCLNIDHN